MTIWCSNDGTTWTDSGIAGATAGTAQTITISGAEFRYVRSIWTVAPLGSFTNSLTGADSIPILQAAQAAFPNGLWWIKDRANNNQHQLVDSVRGGNLALQCPTVGAETAYTAPDGNSVAWCWNYNDANPSVNGFEIIEQTIGNGNATINHQLGATPDFIISKCASGAAASTNFRVYHTSVGVGQSLLLGSTDAASALGQRVSAVAATNFTYSMNVAGNSDMVFYAWRSIPGYSAFGTYSGSNTNDGNFSFLGFKPAFLLVKVINVGGAGTGSDWVIFDSTRNPNNPTNTWLMPNDATAEGTDLVVDFLSNGFKCRDSSGQLNGGGRNFVYAAFAQNPFQAPVTAR